MTTASQTWTKETMKVAGTTLEMVKGGSGDPLLILHDEIGHHAWLNYQESLAENYTVYVPSHPGYGETAPLSWIMNMRDMAGWYVRALDELGLDNLNVLAFSLGGWLAAEIASMCPHSFNKLALVAPAGIKPPTGEILDMFLVVAKEYITTGILDPSNTPEFQAVCPDEATPEQAEAWEVAREESCRLSWKPYMHYPALPHLLGRLRSLPTLIVWGKQDPIIPVSAGDVYHDSIPGSRLALIDDCGHRPELEKTDEFTKLVKGFFSGS